MPWLAVDVLATKARQWWHEREWRSIVGDHDAIFLGFKDFTKASELGYYGIVPGKCITGVIIGEGVYRGPHSGAVLDLLSLYAPTVRSWLAEIDQCEYRVNLRPIRYGTEN